MTASNMVVKEKTPYGTKLLVNGVLIGWENTTIDGGVLVSFIGHSDRYKKVQSWQIIIEGYNMSMIEVINKNIEYQQNKRASAIAKLEIFVEARRFIKRKFFNKEINQSQFGLTMRDLSRQCVYMNNDIHNCNATIRELKREKQKYVTVEDRNNNNDNKKKIDNSKKLLESNGLL